MRAKELEEIINVSHYICMDDLKRHFPNLEYEEISTRFLTNTISISTYKIHVDDGEVFTKCASKIYPDWTPYTVGYMIASITNI